MPSPFAMILSIVPTVFSDISIGKKTTAVTLSPASSLLLSNLKIFAFLSALSYFVSSSAKSANKS